MTANHFLSQLKLNASVIVGLPPAPPAPHAKLCKESTHRMLGHLTACQSAWLPILRGINRAEPSVIAEHPVKHFNRLSLSTEDWSVLIEMFSDHRQEWEKLLAQIDPLASIKTQTKSYTAISLTRRLVLHEAMHLGEHQLL